MLDYVLSKTRRRRLSRRLIFAWIASCLWHFAMLGMLIQFPQLLQGGMYHQFRGLTGFRGLPAPAAEEDDREWRTVAVLRDLPMTAPSAATLRKYVYDWEKNKAGSPPVRVRWGDEQETALKAAAVPIPRTSRERQQPMPPLPAGDTPSAFPERDFPEQIAAAPTASASSPISGRVDANSKGGIYLPPPVRDSTQKLEAADNNAPSSIPSVKPGAGVPNLQQNQGGKDMVARVFDNEQQALRSPEGGLFDTKGFPLGEYASFIIERIKGKWFIPSNLRNAQGHTTIIFFINREGQSTDARIVASSGSDSLDLAALNAIMSSTPFPPLPKGFPGDHIGAKFIFSYNEPQ